MTFNLLEVKSVIRGYFEQLHATKLDHLMRLFLRKHKIYKKVEKKTLNTFVKEIELVITALFTEKSQVLAGLTGEF